MSVDNQDKQTLNAGCHCGRVAFEVDAPKAIRLTDCNCSVCAMSGFLHLFVGKNDIRFTNGSLEDLTLYQFNTKQAQHLFCPTCGVKPLYVPRSHPDGWSVNANCVQQNIIKDAVINPFDGQNWEKNIENLRKTD